MISFKSLALISLTVFLGACRSSSSSSGALDRHSLQNVSDYETKPEFQPICLNQSESEAGIVYLHGMDIAGVSAQEKTNREKLLRIAQKLQISVVVPRATRVCPTSPGQICWGWRFDQAELSQVKERILSAVEKCGSKKVIALIGFSNGGYAVNAFHSQCAADSFGQLFSIGAMLNTSVQKLKYNQGCSGQMVRLIGRQDTLNNNQSAQNLVTQNHFEKQIQVIEFDGGHEIPELILQEQLQKRILQIL